MLSVFRHKIFTVAWTRMKLKNDILFVLILFDVLMIWYLLILRREFIIRLFLSGMNQYDDSLELDETIVKKF